MKERGRDNRETTIGDTLFRTVLEHIPDVVVLYGPDLRIRYINPATTAVTGMAPEEFIGKRDDELFPVAQHKPVLDLLNRALETGRSQSVTIDLELPKTGTQHLAITCLPILDDNGKVREILGITRDETRQRLGEKQLDENRHLLEIAGRMAHLGGWRIDLKTNRVHWSDEVAVIHEMPVDIAPTVEEAIDYYAPEYRDRIREVFEACATAGVPYDEELQILTARGRRVWVRAIGEPVRDAEGRIAAVQGAFMDISKRREAEEALRRNEERYRLLFDANPHPMWVFDRETLRFLTVNDAAVALYGFTREQFLSMTIEEIRPPEEVPRLRASMARRNKTGYMDVGVRRHRKANGEIIEVHITSHDIVLDDRSAELILAQDVSRQRRLEEQLQKSQRLESLGQLTGGVAHDFNNILTVIMGNTELLAERLDNSPELQHMADMMLRSARHGADLTNRLLTFARRQTLEPAPTDIAELIGGMLPMLRRSLPENIDIQLHHARGLWRAEIDPAQLEGALLNLVLNARDAMPEGGALQVETRNAELDRDDAELYSDLEPGEYVQLVLADSGTGIASEHLDRLFEPFFTTKEQGKGTGLGLPMVYGFVKQSGGHIRIHSRPGQGTTVEMYLPRAHGELPVARSAAEDDETALTGNERVLVVEDDEMVREHAKRLFGQLGYQVATVFDADEALRLLEAGERFDLLFTDVIMPGHLDGPGLVEAAYRIDPDMRALYTSGYTQDALVHHRRRPGVGLLQKPYRRVDLARKVREVLDDDSGTDS